LNLTRIPLERKSIILAIDGDEVIFAAIGFLTLLESLSQKKGNYALQLPWYIKLFAPAAGGFIVGPIVFYFAREARGHGVPEVMESIVLRGGAIRPRVMIAKVLASAVSIGSGGSVGREGPIVQIGSAIGSSLGQVLKVTGSHLRTFVACGTAAGIAATFNAPIAGALFAMALAMTPSVWP
jgi:CIC family chloride channel protein